MIPWQQDGSLQDPFSFPQNTASQLQVMPGLALEAQCLEAVFKINPSSSLADQPATRELSPALQGICSAFLPLSVRLVWCRCDRNSGTCSSMLVEVKKTLQGPFNWAAASGGSILTGAEGIGTCTPQKSLAFLPAPIWDMDEGEGHAKDLQDSSVLCIHYSMRWLRCLTSAEKVKP